MLITKHSQHTFQGVLALPPKLCCKLPLLMQTLRSSASSVILPQRQRLDGRCDVAVPAGQHLHERLLPQQRLQPLQAQCAH